MAPKPSFPPGALAVVALPLGNPADITLRALQVLAEADLVAAEDTRTAGRLLARHGVRAPLLSYHDWNEDQRAPALIGRLEQGQRIALVSEAGTPGISDPGYDVVRLARQRGIPVFPVPGPCAVTAFLSVSGLPTDAFSFFGFPPSRPPRRRELFHSLSDRRETLVFYESPRRVLAALAAAEESFGDREAALGRELTKPHEEVLFGTLSSLQEALAPRARVLGEVCWGVRGAQAVPPRPDEPSAAALQEAAGSGLPPREAARVLAKRSGLSVKEAYTLLLRRR
ncbi:MAG: 16S rRNA (cytidine(1402)-2'-O)-methyltransferase [Deferrisomatales bacterium]|nr:16S rRNA (cytidine(1402)-2'-O)-methyltransferase [Deferrisomatales bacterium]